jgi:hypothetical protein
MSGLSVLERLLIEGDPISSAAQLNRLGRLDCLQPRPVGVDPVPTSACFIRKLRTNSELTWILKKKKKNKQTKRLPVF